MKHAELFAGYGGLSLAVEEIFDAELAWYAEFDGAPSKIMARHWPGIPNHGDVTTVDWSTVEPVDIISGGSPCQDVSAAGRRAGMNEGTRSNLWVAMREAIAAIKPTYVVWENVRGAHSAGAYSAVESEPGLLGDHGAPYLRATGRVAGDLSTLGYDAQWRTISASSVGAPHRRERVFLLAWRRDATVSDGDGRRDRGRTAAPREGAGERPDTTAVLPGDSHGGTGSTAPVALLGTPRTADGMSSPLRSPEAVGDPRGRLESQIALLPTPVAQPSGNTPEDHLRKKPGRDTVTDLAILVENDLLSTGGKMLPTPQANLASNGGSQHPDKRREGGHSVSIQDVVEHLLPTPKAADADFGLPRTSGRPPEMSTHLATRIHYTNFGVYAPAIARWERVLRRPSPAPTVLSAKGKNRLSHYFAEFMQGVPLGWICDTPGVTPNESIRAAGNGVVPQQAAVALRDMLKTLEEGPR